MHSSLSGDMCVCLQSCDGFRLQAHLSFSLLLRGATPTGRPFVQSADGLARTAAHIRAKRRTACVPLCTRSHLNLTQFDGCEITQRDDS